MKNEKPEAIDVGGIYLAKHTSENKYYIVKRLQKKILILKDLIAEIEVRKNILFKADSPFHQGLEYFFNHETYIYFLTPAVDGLTLSGLVKQNKKPLSESSIKHIAFQIAIAIDNLHEKGILHRNIWPEGIIVEKDGYIKVSDFENACMLGEDEEAEDSPPCLSENQLGYRAPELLNQQPHNKAVDWWSLGVVMYRLLTNKRPYAGNSSQEVFEHI